MRHIGLDGEAIAAKYLQKINYKVLTKNFHSRFGEVDIVAVNNHTIVFVEVKLRSSNLFGTPLEAITSKKLEKIKKTAFYYLSVNNMSSFEFRFDAIEIIVQSGEMKINHVKNITL